MMSLEFTPETEARLRDGLNNSMIAKTLYAISGIWSVLGGFFILVGLANNMNVAEFLVILMGMIFSCLFTGASALILAYFVGRKTT